MYLYLSIHIPLLLPSFTGSIPATSVENAVQDVAVDANDTILAPTTVIAPAQVLENDVKAVETSMSADAPADEASAAQPEPFVDLSGELYNKQATDKAQLSAPPSAEVVSQANQTDAPPKKKRGFRAAWGAIRELLK